MAGAPHNEAAPAWLHSCPPKRFFGLGDDVAPGQADIVPFTFGQLGQLVPVVPALEPDVEGLGELGQQPGTMMIYHVMI
jgi:hypothetical protein